MSGQRGQRSTCECCGSVVLICQNPACGKVSPRGATELAAKWGTRMYCSTECAQAMRQKIRWDGIEKARKPCEQCGKDAVQRQGESPALFEKRRFCSKQCSYDHRRAAGAATRAEILERRAARLAKKQESDAKKAAQAREHLIRKGVAAVAPGPPESGVWRPAAWRATDEARR